MIKISDVSRSVLELYTVPNPEYYQMIKAGKDPRYKSLTKDIRFGGQLPPGAAFWSASAGQKLSQGNSMDKGPLIYPSAKLEMRSYQAEPVEMACKVRAGIIEAPTGSGKTACASKIIQESGQKTLFLCHSIELMHQTALEIEDFLDVKPSLFYGKTKEFGNITISTYQSAVQNFQEFASQGFDLLLVDEADMFTTDNYIDFLCRFPCKRAFGFTATINVEKYDSNMTRQIRLMERLWGFVIKIETDMQTDILDNIVIYEHEKQYVDKYGIPIIPRDWALFRSELDIDEERQEAQIEYIIGNTLPDDFALVLLDRLADVDKYFSEISFKNPGHTYKLHGKMKDRERKETVAAYKSTGGILVGNVKIIGRGFNVPEANRSFLFCPMKGETPLRQAVGRILRFIPDKKSELHVWSDSSLYSQQKKKMKIFEEFYPNANIIHK